MEQPDDEDFKFLKEFMLVATTLRDFGLTPLEAVEKAIEMLRFYRDGCCQDLPGAEPADEWDEGEEWKKR